MPYHCCRITRGNTDKKINGNPEQRTIADQITEDHQCENKTYKCRDDFTVHSSYASPASTRRARIPVKRLHKLPTTIKAIANMTPTPNASQYERAIPGRLLLMNSNRTASESPLTKPLTCCEST